jgi:hypothetical protein
MRSSIIVLALFLFMFMPVQADGTKVARPPTIEEVTGRWVGYTKDDLNFFQCELRPEGDGYCAIVWLHNEPALYRIHSWILDKSEVTFETEPLDSNEESIFMRGVAGSHLYLKVGGTSGKWERDLKLYRASEVQSLLDQTTQRLEEAPNVNQ